MRNIANPRLWEHPRRKGFNVNERIDLTETVMFRSAARTSSSGEIKGSFYLSDLVTKFRIIADSFNSAGTLGY